jgi:[CysO sulfur-carrier protein]-S-L-cysteine hydrolase
MSIVLNPEILDDLVSHARAAVPNEGCGLLVGRNATAERFIAMENVLKSPTAFEMDPAALITALRELRETGEQLVAIYHSHPGGPERPSQTDIARAFYPEAAHVIVSLERGEMPVVRGFRIIDGEAIEIDLHAIV